MPLSLESSTDLDFEAGAEKQVFSVGWNGGTWNLDIVALYVNLEVNSDVQLKSFSEKCSEVNSESAS